MKSQNFWWALAVFCLFGGFLAVAEHDYINNIPVSNAVSAIGYVVGIAGTVGSLAMVYKTGKPKDQ